MYDNHNIITALYRNLSRKYLKHFKTIKKVWKISNRAKWEQLFEGCTRRHYDPEPEWNVADIAAEPDNFLRMLTWRATASLKEQFRWGLDGGPGDYAVVDDKEWNPPLYHPYIAMDEFYVYFSDHLYEETIDVREDEIWEDAEKFDEDVKAFILLPSRISREILRRQVNIFYCLNALVDRILDTDKARCLDKQARNAEEEHTTPTLQGLIASTKGYATHYGMSLTRLRSDAEFFYECVTDQFVSRFENVPINEDSEDEYRVGSVGKDIFNAVHTRILSHAFWQSISELLLILFNSTKNTDMVLKQIHHLCRHQFSIARENVARNIATGVARGCFDCLAGPGHNMYFYRGKLVFTNLHLHLLADLCTCRTRDTDMAVYQLRKLDEFYKRKPEERRKLSARESEALYELCCIVAFMKDFKIVFPESKADMNYRSRDTLVSTHLYMLHCEVEEVKEVICSEISDVNMKDLKDPLIARRVLDGLTVSDKRELGTSIDHIYRDMVSDLIKVLQSPELLAHLFEVMHDPLRLHDRLEQDSQFLSILEPESERNVQARRVRDAGRLLLPSYGAELDFAGRWRIAGGRRRIVRSEIAQTILALFDKPHLRGRDLNGICACIAGTNI